ncbi:MAG: bifunctional oligoribonuclease/PAP phosphatase NrnA [Ruminococcus sp.]|nr:bifunctional oligoribonuclease/PAP phosphatase NrnA [Ruminococcus sp.]
MYIGFSEAETFIRNCKDAVIITHRNPDGDCTGAGFAMKEILKQLGIRSRVVCHDVFPKRYDFLTGDAEDEDFEPQTIIAVDVADKKLMGKYEEIYGDKVQLCIDHHVSNRNYAEKTLLRADAAAACEVIYDLAKFMGLKLTKHCIECLYTGIATDSGCFRFACTTPHTHEVAAEMMREYSDINFTKINRNMFDVKSAGRIRLESRLNDMIETYIYGKLCIIAVTKDIMEELGVSEDELEGFAPLTIQYENAEVGIFIRQRADDYKCSFRSADKVNVSEICETLGGGGHEKAAGCNLSGDLEDIKKQLIAAVCRAL